MSPAASWAPLIEAVGWVENDGGASSVFEWEVWPFVVTRFIRSVFRYDRMNAVTTSLEYPNLNEWNDLESMTQRTPHVPREVKSGFRSLTRSVGNTIWLPALKLRSFDCSGTTLPAGPARSELGPLYARRCRALKNR